jgi:hypothetical protein
MLILPILADFSLIFPMKSKPGRYPNRPSTEKRRRLKKITWVDPVLFQARFLKEIRLGDEENLVKFVS